MKKFFAIARGCSLRIVTSIIFTIIWQKYTEGSVPIGNCLVLCGAICGLSAWFSYLHMDGVKLMGNNTTIRDDGHTNRFLAFLTRKEGKKTSSYEKDSQDWADPFYNKQEPEDKPFIMAGALNGLISMVLLIGASFFI